jgi:hypothetical protein
MEDREDIEEVESEEEIMQDKNTVVITQSHPNGTEHLEPKTHGLPPSSASLPWQCGDGSAVRGSNNVKNNVKTLSGHCLRIIVKFILMYC